MYHAFLLKYGEIGIKGKNRYLFEEALVDSVRRALKDFPQEFEVTRPSGRIFVECKEDFDFEDVLHALQNVFGLVEICPVVLVPDEGFDKLAEKVVEFVDKVYPEKNFTFKVKCRRSRKDYPLDSMQLAAELGGRILDAFPTLSVDVHKPDVYIYVEVRTHNLCIYSKEYEGLGGLPYGTSGKAMLLLSGGIDSPVAGFRVAKRGVKIDAIYFHAPPYTSERAKQKVVDLAHQVAKYSGPMNLYVVNFTDIQLCILDHCPHDELTIIMRRYMMAIAEHFAKEEGCMGLITGESIGQVASQTMQSLECTNAAVSMPVYRPLIAYDKQEIVNESQTIGTFETSILPYEDCCTIFVAKHPVTKPKLDRIEKSETHLVGFIEPLLEKAIDEVEVISID